MPAHLKQKRNGMFYLVDGFLCKSLKTKTKRHAESLLKSYCEGKYNPSSRTVPTVGNFYETWIEKKIEPLVRRAQIRDYKQHFKSHILSSFKNVPLLDIRTRPLSDFQVNLLKKNLEIKTARNIFDGHLGRCIATPGWSTTNFRGAIRSST